MTMMGPLILRPSSCRSSCLRVCRVVRETNCRRNYRSIVKDKMTLTSEFEVEEVEAHKEKATMVYLTKLGSVNDSVGCVGLDSRTYTERLEVVGSDSEAEKLQSSPEFVWTSRARRLTVSNLNVTRLLHFFTALPGTALRYK